MFPAQLTELGNQVKKESVWVIKRIKQLTTQWKVVEKEVGKECADLMTPFMVNLIPNVTLSQ